MPFEIATQIDGQPLAFTLDEGVSRVGSGPDCGVRLTHPEAPPLALTVEVRGEAVVARNHSAYAIFVGQEKIEPGQIAAWPDGANLQLTRSIVLGGRSLGSGDAGIDDEPVAKPRGMSHGKIAQIGVIALCAVIGIQQLLAGPAEPVAKVEVSFDQLLAEIDTQIQASASNGSGEDANRWRQARGLLQEAHFLDIRPGRREPRHPMDAYQRLLDSDAVRDASTDDDTLAGRVFRYATAKKVLAADR